MNLTFETTETFTNIEALPDYEGVSHRFIQGFTAFVQEKKHHAAIEGLRGELSNSEIANSDNLIAAVASRVDEEALLEKRYIFLSLNPNCLV